MATAFREGAAPAGIRIDVRVTPAAGYWSNVWMVEAFTTSSWAGRPPDEALAVVYKSDTVWNESFYKNPEVDRLILQARGQSDPEERQATYGELQCLLIDEVPSIIPVFRPVFMGLRSNVRGLEAHPQSWPLLHDTWLEIE